MTVHILYTHFYDREGEKLSVGGIQTYILNLSNALINEGYHVNVYQTANRKFEKELNGIHIIGCVSSANFKEAKKVLMSECRKYLDVDDLIVFATDGLTTKTDNKSIAIQHGIFWDIPKKDDFYLARYVKKSIDAYKMIKQTALADAVVCVDYNYINWIRAVAPVVKTKLIAIPNFTEVPESIIQRDNKNELNIIFARRFFWYRGTRVFAAAAERVLREYNNVKITIAGEGPDEELLKKKFDNETRVTFTKYTSEESLAIHQKNHIAVVPTVGSEGTSLSLLEAMAAGCAVVCTDVGGMTNIVLNGYNGLIVPANDPEELGNALCKLVEDEQLRNRLSQNAYTTAKDVFSIDKWSAYWIKLVNDIIKKNDVD